MMNRDRQNRNNFNSNYLDDDPSSQQSQDSQEYLSIRKSSLHVSSYNGEDIEDGEENSKGMGIRAGKNNNAVPPPPALHNAKIRRAPQRNEKERKKNHEHIEPTRSHSTRNGVSKYDSSSMFRLVDGDDDNGSLGGKRNQKDLKRNEMVGGVSKRNKTGENARYSETLLEFSNSSTSNEFSSSSIIFDSDEENKNTKKRFSRSGDNSPLYSSSKKQKIDSLRAVSASDLPSKITFNHLSEDVICVIFSFLGLPGSSAQDIMKSLSRDKACMTLLNKLKNKTTSKYYRFNNSEYMGSMLNSIPNYFYQIQNRHHKYNNGEDEVNLDLLCSEDDLQLSPHTKYRMNNRQTIFTKRKGIRQHSERVIANKETRAKGMELFSVFETSLTLQLVCKFFRDTILKMSEFYGAFHLSDNLAPKIKYDQILNVVCGKQFNSLVHTLVLRSNSLLQDEHLITIADSLHKSLTHIDISRCEKITDNGLKHLFHKCIKLIYVDISTLHKVTDESISVLGKRCKSLEDLNLGSCVMITGSCLWDLQSLPRLSKLNLEFIYYLDVNPLFALVSQCPITHLNVCGLAELNNLHPLFNLEEPVSQTQSQSLSNQLSLPDTDSIENENATQTSSTDNSSVSPSKRGFAQLMNLLLRRSPRLPALEELRVTERAEVDIRILTEFAPKVKVLYCHLSTASDESFARLIKENGCDFEFVSFQGCLKFGQSSGEALLKHCPKLVTANLYRSTQAMPKDFVKKLLRNKKIEFLI